MVGTESMAGTRAYILGDSSVVLWGVGARERLRRQIASLQDVQLVNSVEELAGADSVLLVRADFLFEVRTLSALIARRGVLCFEQADGQQVAAAAHVDPGDLDEALAMLEGHEGGLPILTAESLQSYESSLRRTDPPTLEPLDENRKEALESRLYGSAYKGVTDLVTKFWWPRPARRVVAWCADRHITPNTVTLTGFALMLLAGWCFYEGAYIPGLVAGWLMTFLDTVDGKLARVTVQSSRAGHLLDHGMDLIHPPFWYWLWGLGLDQPPSLWGFEATALYVALFLGYIGGRVAEGLFHTLGDVSIFTWRPFDSYFRLVTGRRNPCLILLTVFTLMGRPDWAFLSVVIWTVATTGVLFLRLLQGAVVRLIRAEPLKSWLADPQQAAREHPAAFRTFATTKSAYGSG